MEMMREWCEPPFWPFRCQTKNNASKLENNCFCVYMCLCALHESVCVATMVLGLGIFGWKKNSLFMPLSVSVIEQPMPQSSSISGFTEACQFLCSISGLYVHRTLLTPNMIQYASNEWEREGERDILRDEGSFKLFVCCHFVWTHEGYSHNRIFIVAHQLIGT